MLALVDDVPRTLRLDQFISYWISHQIEVIQRRTQHRLDDAQARAHIYRGLVIALDQLDEVIALIRRGRAPMMPGRGSRLRWRSTSCRRTRSWTCSCAGLPHWSGSGSSTSWQSTSESSPT